MCIQIFFQESLKGRDNLEDTDIYDRIMLKRILKNGMRESGNEPVGFINYWEFLGYLSKY
jgi:hypothetical protein